MYEAEIAALEELLAPIRADLGTDARGLEVGVGTGRFAAPLKIGHGVEPAPKMAELARHSGIDVTEAPAEALPFDDATFDHTAFITSLCFVTDAARSLHEARRVTREGGWILVAFLNRASALGEQLAATQHSDPFYEHATLRTADEIEALLQQAGYRVHDARQVTLSDDGRPEVRPGTDAGLFCAFSARLTNGH
ncbi:class I SAM-dependent methyltransferase [Enemella sp. A6]|uniref:class I SAM-dependent methyltransferase n=1 Tax=Enemella sp. A6 TaxID=3440152 RepID=UPI003EB83DAA